MCEKTMFQDLSPNEVASAVYVVNKVLGPKDQEKSSLITNIGYSILANAKTLDSEMNIQNLVELYKVYAQGQFINE